jgi:hypothetical protein
MKSTGRSLRICPGENGDDGDDEEDDDDDDDEDEEEDFCPLDLEHLGHMLLMMGRPQDAVIAFEQQIARGQDGLLHCNVICDGCRDSIRLPSIRYVCWSCQDIDLCTACHQSYELEGRLYNNSPTCHGHEFLAVPRDAWSTLLFGTVSADGTTIEEWMKRLLGSLYGMQHAARH